MSQSKFLDIGSSSNLSNGLGSLNINDVRTNRAIATSADVTDLTVSGDATITGTLTATTAIFVDELKVSDNIIELAINNPADNLNNGILQEYNDGAQKWAGLIRSKDDKNTIFSTMSL